MFGDGLDGYGSAIVAELFEHQLHEGFGGDGGFDLEFRGYEAVDGVGDYFFEGFGLGGGLFGEVE